MSVFLQVFLPSYFLLYFFFAFVLRGILVAKRFGYNPMVLPSSDDAYGLIGLYFKVMLVSIFLYTILVAFNPGAYKYLGPVHLLKYSFVQYVGIFLLFIALVWTIIAQVHMGASWRIGIDLKNKTELITTGLFTYSRNPVFVGMLGSLLGLFLTTPNLLTLFFLLLGYVLIQLQVRLEEAYLRNVHGLDYLTYKRQTKRFL